MLFNFSFGISGVGDVLHPCILLADSRYEIFLRCVMVMVRDLLLGSALLLLVGDHWHRISIHDERSKRLQKF